MHAVTDKKLKWRPIENTITDRMLDNSLLHTLDQSKKIKKQTKICNLKLKRKGKHSRSLKYFLKLRKQVQNTCQDSVESDDETILDDEDIKKIHSTKVIEPHSHLQSFLRLCVRAKKRKWYPQDAVQKSPKLDRRKCNYRTLTKANRSLETLSFSEPKKFESPENDANLKNKCNNKMTKNLVISDTEEESENNSLKSDSEETKILEIKNNDVEQHSSEDRAIRKTQYEVTHRSESPSSHEVESEVSNFQSHDNYDTFTDHVGDLTKPKPVVTYTKMLNDVNLFSEADIFKSQNEKIDSGDSLCNKIEGDDFAAEQNQNSGEISLSDKDSLIEEYKSSTSKKNSNLQDSSCLLFKAVRPEKDVIELSETVDSVSFENITNSSRIQLQGQKFIEDEKESDSSSVSEMSQEIGIADAIRIPQLATQFSTGSSTDNNNAKPKICTIKHCNGGCEIFSKRQLSKQNKFKNVNQCNKKSVENDSVSEAEESTKSVEIKSQHMNPSIDQKNFSPCLTLSMENAIHSMEDDLKLEIEMQSNGSQTSTEHDLLEIKSSYRNQSLNSSFSSSCGRSYNEGTKNIIKLQLLTEIEQRLKDTSFHKKSPSPCNELQESNPLLYDDNLNSKNSNFEALIPTESITKDTQSLYGNEPIETLSSPEIQPQKLDRFVQIVNCSIPPKSTSTKRRFSDTTTVDHTPVLTKQHRLHERSTKTKLKSPSRGRKSPSMILHKSRPIQDNNQSSNAKNGALNTSHSTQQTREMKPRPQNLEEFIALAGLTEATITPHFRLKNITDDDEIWIMDVPKTIDPKTLLDKTIFLGGQSELRLGDDCYKVSSKHSKHISNKVSCVFSTNKLRKEYKIVNIESKGVIKFKKRVSRVNESEPLIVDQPTPTKISTVPFPKNLKIRHPLFGASYMDKI